MILKKIAPLLLPMLVAMATAATEESQTQQQLEDLEDLQPLDLKQFRSGRQFKQAASGNDDGVAIGLIDALQRWADALEAQISIMKNEVLSLKNSNRNFKDEVIKVRDENKGLRTEVATLKALIQENQGNDEKDSDTIETKVDSMRNDLMVFSKSFSDFLEHYDTTVKETRTNHSMMTNQMVWIKNNVKDLSSTLGSSDHNVESVRSTIEGLQNSLQILSQTDFILEERLRSMENETKVTLESVSISIMKMQNTMVSPSFLNEAITNLTQDMHTLKVTTDVNITTLSFSVKAMEQTLTVMLQNTSMDVGTSIKKVHDFVNQLQGDFKLQSEAVQEDFDSFKKSIAFAKDRYDELLELTSTLDNKLEEHVDFRANFTRAVMAAMNDFGARLGDAESSMEVVMPQIDLINSSITTFIGQVGTEILNLQSKDEGLRNDLDKLNLTVSQHEVTTFVQGNLTLSLREQIYHLEHDMTTLQGNTSSLTLSVSESVRNHTLMFSGLRALEKHFIDVKKDMFEMKLNIVSVNATLTNLGEVGTDLTRMRVALTDTVDGVNQRLEEISADTGTIKDDLTMLWNNTATLSNRVQRLAENITDTTNNFNSALDNVSSLHLQSRKNIEKIGNKTNILEVGLTGLMNYSVEVQGNLSRMLVFAAENKAGILELKVADTNLEDKVDELFDMHDIHKDRVTENKGATEANLTRLSGLTSALEGELDTMTERYKTLEALFNNYVKSAGDLESDVARLRDDTIATKNDLDTVKYDLASVKAESTGVDVFVSSIQNHISSLTSNMTSVAANLTNARNEITDNKARMGQMSLMMEMLSANVTENRNGLLLADEQFQISRVNASTLKANILGLGNYINNINTDLGKLANSFEKYIGELTTSMSEMRENITNVESDLEDEAADLKTSIQVREKKKK